MLSSARMEEFVTEEEEPWYDQQDLEQGKTESPSIPRQPRLQHHWPDPLFPTKALHHAEDATGSSVPIHEASFFNLDF